MKIELRITIIAIVALSSLGACGQLFSRLDNPSDPRASSYPGYPTVADSSAILPVVPADGGMLASSAVTVTRAAGANAYGIRIAESVDALESAPAMQKSGYPSNVMDLTAADGSLTAGMTYVWQARASLDLGATWGAWSAVFSFTPESNIGPAASPQASPSASPGPSATPDPTPTPTPTPIPTPFPTPLMVSVPMGSFNNNGFFDVTISAFEMSATEITQAQYVSVIGSNPSIFLGDPNRPVDRISWYMALVFCNRLSSLAGLAPCYTIAGSTDPAIWGAVPTGDNSTWNAAIVDMTANGYRLPTEMEWMYAAKGGTPVDSFTYPGSNTVDQVAWYSANSGSTTHPVGTKSPNSLGLYDMGGNVSEWCWDWYVSAFTSTPPQTNPKGASSALYRTLRGGNWNMTSPSIAVTSHAGGAADYVSSERGIRVVRRPSSAPPSMVSVPAGSISLDTLTATLSAFTMSATEVTQGQYAAIMGINPSTFTGNPARPVETVSWYDSLVFCNQLSIQAGLQPCYSISGGTNPNAWGAVPTADNSTWNAATVNMGANGYRLPTEAEWEYAARGGAPLDSYAYAGSDTIGDAAWYDANALGATHAVKGKAANKLGLYDMSGNAYERCWDWYDAYPSASQTDPTGAVSGTLRVLRGGSWFSVSTDALVSNRNWGSQHPRLDYCGIRVVRRP
jgi:formylglycine-generating enzyme required for sulfatase activity